MSNSIVGYEHLHLHTDFSVLDGYGMVEEYAKRAKEINQQYLCISDHGALGAIPRQIKACEKNGINPIFACELYCNPMQPEVKPGETMSVYTADMSQEERKRLNKSYHLLAIAYNQIGYSNLVKISSWGWTRGFYRKPRVNHDVLLAHKEGIIFTSCCYMSEIGQAFERGGEDEAFDMVEKYMAMFGDKFYLEIMLLDFVKQKPYDAFIIKAHEKYGVPLIVTNDCLAEGTLILTSEGLKPIEEIDVGDKVLTHKNRFQPVEFVNKRKINDGEKVYRVKTSLGTFIWDVTGNHPVRVASVGYEHWTDTRKSILGYSWKNVEDLSENDYLVFPKIKEDTIFSKENLDKIDVKEHLDKSDYTIPECAGTYNYSNKLRLEEGCFVSHHRFDKKSTIRIPRWLCVTDDFLEIVGLYMSEGGVEKNGNLISFGLHKNEVKELELIKRYFGQFGIKVHIKDEGNGICAKFSSVVFRKFFASLCGEGAKNKRFPLIGGARFKTFSKAQLLKIIYSYWKGDGHDPKLHERPGMVGSTSKLLIYDLAIILNSLGIFCLPAVRDNAGYKHRNPNANVDNWNDLYYISFSGDSRIKFKNLFGYNLNFRSTTNKGKMYIEDDECYAVKLLSKEVVEYKGHVYNFQVKDDESYIANLGTVHNCHYCQKDDSRMQRLMLMVQTGRTIQQIERAMADDAMADFFELQDQNLWQKSEEELNEKWHSDYKDIIDADLFAQAKMNTVKICEIAKGVELDRSIKLPVIDDADEALKEAVLQGFKQRKLPHTRVYLDRIKEELHLIYQKGFSSYFLIQKMMTDEARRVCPKLLGFGDGSEAVGPGRGSGVGALTNYCLGITDVNPLEHDLLFWRFLSPARGGRQMRIRFNDDPIKDNDEIVGVEKVEEIEECPF